MAASTTTVRVGEIEVRLSSPDRVVFPSTGTTKADLVAYYRAVEDGVMRGIRSRPLVLRRFPKGVDEPGFYAEHLPERRPDWLGSARVCFASGRTAEQLCCTNLAHVVWALNLGAVDLHPWPVRRWDPEHPDELRIDLDPQPGVQLETLRQVTSCVAEVLEEHGLVGWPKTSGGRGIHVLVRIVAVHEFREVRRAALALAREVQRRLPDDATAAWLKAERGTRVFVDFNQNARDRTVASAYCVRPNSVPLVSLPFAWSELDLVEPAECTMATAVERFAASGDLHAGIDEAVGSLDGLLALAERDDADGLADAPWPVHHPRGGG